MNKKSIKYFLLIFIVVLSLAGFNPLMSQSLSTKKTTFWNSNWNFGLNIGGNQFYGDVSSHSFFKKWSKESPLGIQLYLTKMLQSSWGVGLKFNYAGIKSIKDVMPDGTVVDYSLSGSYFSFNPYLYLNLNDLILGYNQNRFWALYTKLGMGYAMWNTTLTNNITGTSIKSGDVVGNHTYAKHALEIPVTTGVRFRLSNCLSANAGVEFNTILSDDVDGWNQGKYDKFTYVFVGITYSFNHTFQSKARKKKDDECNLQNNVPLYNYTYYSSPESSLKKASVPAAPDVLSIQSPVPPTRVTIVTPKITNNTGVEFRVQIMATIKKMGIGYVQSRFNLSIPVQEVHQDGYYRYTVGHYNSYQSALAESKKLQAQGITDAFVTAYKNGLRVPLTNAMMNRP